MKRFLFNILFALIAISTICTSCIEDDFTTSSNDLLSFSTDTIAFDTIFTELSTPVSGIMIYNRHKKMINVSSIRIKGESAAKFYLNVDGEKGENFSNIEIRGEDSIFVYISAYIDPTNANKPLEYKDKIEFITNGVAQDIIITAWGQDVNRIKKGTIDTNCTFTAEKPYVIFDTLTVNEGVTLNIEAGASLYFHDKAAIKVNGNLQAIGTQDAEINMRGDRTDKVVGDISFDIMSGQWGGIIFSANSYNNEMQYVNMRGSSNGIMIDSCNTDIRKLHLFNSILHNASNSVIESKYAWIEAQGCEFSDAGSSVAVFTGGKIRIANCTFANYYLFSAIDGAIINLDYIFQEKEVQAMDATFDNCILYGNASDLNIGDLTNSNIYFRNCLLKSQGSNDNNFISCKWEGNPKFYTVREDYIFNYRLRNESDAIAIGDRSLCPDNARYDRYGNDRFASEGIDIGAYVWIKSDEEEKQ